MSSYPCPCCGFRTLWRPPGSGDVCQVCSWEDDVVQLRWPTWAGGSNRPSLIEAQRTAASSGTSDLRYRAVARPASPDEHQDPGWRPLHPATDTFEPADDRATPWPRDLTRLYWWRTTYWRR